MTMGGITSSLNATLARLNAIESNFKSLNGVTLEFDIPKNNQVEEINNSDFKAILDEKTNAAEDIKEEEVQQTQQTQEPAPIEEIETTTEVDELKKEAINLKSKIDLKAQSTNIDEIIETFSNKYDIDSDFIKAIIKQESGFNPNATSKKGAMGLMQLMPATAKSLGISNAYNPWENIEGGVKHLRGLLNKYDNNQELALAAYNAGSGAVKKYGGVPPYKETQNYVKAIMSAYNKTKEAKI
jgi:membrane-bound lytic murein transglycosylase B